MTLAADVGTAPHLHVVIDRGCSRGLRTAAVRLTSSHKLNITSNAPQHTVLWGVRMSKPKTKAYPMRNFLLYVSTNYPERVLEAQLVYDKDGFQIGLIEDVEAAD